MQKRRLLQGALTVTAWGCYEQGVSVHLKLWHVAEEMPMFFPRALLAGLVLAQAGGCSSRSMFVKDTGLVEVRRVTTASSGQVTRETVLAASSEGAKDSVGTDYFQRKDGAVYSGTGMGIGQMLVDEKGEVLIHDEFLDDTLERWDAAGEVSMVWRPLGYYEGPRAVSAFTDVVVAFPEKNVARVVEETDWGTPIGVTAAVVGWLGVLGGLLQCADEGCGPLLWYSLPILAGGSGLSWLNMSTGLLTTRSTVWEVK